MDLEDLNIDIGDINAAFLGPRSSLRDPSRPPLLLPPLPVTGTCYLYNTASNGSNFHTIPFRLISQQMASLKVGEFVGSLDCGTTLDHFPLKLLHH